MGESRKPGVLLIRGRTVVRELMEGRHVRAGRQGSRQDRRAAGFLDVGQNRRWRRSRRGDAPRALFCHPVRNFIAENLGMARHPHQGDGNSMTKLGEEALRFIDEGQVCSSAPLPKNTLETGLIVRKDAGSADSSREHEREKEFQGNDEAMEFSGIVGSCSK